MKIRKPIHDNWETPQEVLSAIKSEFGNFFDPCPLNNDLSKWDGLKSDWQGGVCFINPPYSRKLKEAFIMKALEESKKGKTCILLLPVSTDTKIFHEVIYPNAIIRFLKGRVKFKGINSKGIYVTNNSGMSGSMLVIFKGDMARSALKYGKGNDKTKRAVIKTLNG